MYKSNIDKMVIFLKAFLFHEIVESKVSFLVKYVSLQCKLNVDSNYKFRNI